MIYVHLAVGLVALLTVTSAVRYAARLPDVWTAWSAILRATVQLAFVAIALHGALTHPPYIALALGVMLAVAIWTSGRRLRDLPGSATAVVIAGVAAAAMTLGLSFTIGVLPGDRRYVVALGGIVIGSIMTGMTLAGRRFRAESIGRRPEIEGWLAIGATPAQATADIGRAAAHEALVPTTDQTRTTGLVTLPGAFVGALMGGASPLDAGRFQLVVLAAILSAQAIAAVLLVRILGRSPVLPIGVQ